jgi:putative addiction module component (TIGR02574 family)
MSLTNRQRASMMKPLDDEWRERLQVGAARLPLQKRTALLERLLVSHESFDEIMASWDAEIERRIDDYDAGRSEGIPAEVVLAKMREIIERAPENPDPPPIPDTFREIMDQALHLPHGDFYLLLQNLEAALPRDVDPAWRADIQRRIAAVPSNLEERYIRYNGGWQDDEPCRARRQGIVQLSGIRYLGSSPRTTAHQPVD